MNFGPNVISTGAFPLVNMTWGHSPWSRVTIKSKDVKLAFLLGKSVHVFFIHILFWLEITPTIVGFRGCATGLFTLSFDFTCKWESEFSKY